MLNAQSARAITYGKNLQDQQLIQKLENLVRQKAAKGLTSVRLKLNGPDAFTIANVAWQAGYDTELIENTTLGVDSMTIVVRW